MLHVHDTAAETVATAADHSKPVKTKGTLSKSAKITVETQDKTVQSKQHKKRPASAPASSHKKGPASAEAAVAAADPSVDLRSYSKSLRLLGLDIPSNRREATKVQVMEIFWI
jgi:hypothetical protein